MIYRPPQLQETDRAILDVIAEQRDRLRIYTQSSPKRWLGSLRRSTFARAIQGSNSIEGYHATIDDVIAVVADEPPLDERTETWLAIQGYRNALTYISQASQDRCFEFGKQFLKSLHFMMIGFDLSKHPGQWRPGPIWVVNERSGGTVYEGPAADLVNDLAGELVDYLKSPTDGEPAIVRAAMAHLNLAMIHPFKDGNGRMARALQTFVLAREGILHPAFSSIDEWLGRNSEEYYAVLAEIGQGIWNPTREALPWIRFCLKAHYQQAATLIRRNEEYALLYDRLSELVESLGLPDRSLLPLFDTALGFRLTNIRYRNDAEVSEFVASRDLKRLCDAGLLEPIGEKRGRTYKATGRLKTLRHENRIRKTTDDPYDVIKIRGQPRLPGV